MQPKQKLQEAEESEQRGGWAAVCQALEGPRALTLGNPRMSEASPPQWGDTTSMKFPRALQMPV